MVLWHMPAYARGEVFDFVGKFWSKVDVRGPDECWPWIAKAKVSEEWPYGLVGIGQRGHRSTRTASDVAYELSRREEVPAGKCVMHTCDRPQCVNPAHLVVGTHADNKQDSFAKGRSKRLQGVALAAAAKTECIRGHPLSGANLRIDRNGTKRTCRACERAKDRRNWPAKRARLAAKRASA